MPKIILATISPYRREIFACLGIDFEAVGSNVDESQTERKNPEALVKTLSRLKAEAVAKNYQEAIVIGMDSVAYFKGRILEKPKSKEEAFLRLKSLSGQDGQFYTGVFMVNTASGKTLAKVVKTELSMRRLSDEEIKKYLDEDQGFNTYALGFDTVKHTSASFIKSIKGSYYNLLAGMPLEAMMDMLRELGYKEE